MKNPHLSLGTSNVFVPMFGDLFFTSWQKIRQVLQEILFSSPCLGILFSLAMWLKRNPHQGGPRFRPHVWGSFFHRQVLWATSSGALRFSSPCLGILFSQKGATTMATENKTVFVPMFGDPFFTLKRNPHQGGPPRRFRPHVWGSFFHLRTSINVLNVRKIESGFRPHVWGSFFHAERCSPLMAVPSRCFRPHVWGSFFHSRPGRPHGVGSLWPFCGGDFQLIGILIIFTL